MPFSISGLLSSLNRYQSLIVLCVCEVNFVLFNSMLKYVINRLMHAFSISSREADIGQSDNSPDMEKGMH
jgi:hypothetical protein